MSKGRGILRWIGRGLLRTMVWAAAVGGAAYLGSAWYLPPVLEGVLARRFPDAGVSVQGVRFSGLGVLVKGLAVAEDEASLASSPIFFAERVRVTIALGELLKRRVVVRSVGVRDAVLTAEFEKERGWNVLRLGLGGREDGVPRLPVVRIERGAVRVRRIVDGRVVPVAAVGLDGQITTTNEAGEYRFSLRADERLALSGSHAEGVLRVGGAGQKSELSLAGQVRMPRVRILDNAWNLDEVELMCAFDAEAVEVERLSFRMGEGVGTASGRLELARDGAFDVKTDLAGFVISDTHSPDTVVYGDSAMELLGPWAERFLRQYRPRGRGDVDLELQGRWDELGQTAITGQVVCRDITIEDTQFPYELERMEGVITFSGRSLTLDSLKTRHGESVFLIDGSIDDFGSEMEIRLRVVSGMIAFDEDVYRALGSEAKRMWFAFSPSGMGAIDHTYRRFSDGRKDRLLAVDLIDVGAIYEHFPYPLEHLTGRIVFEPNRTTLSSIEAHYADARKVRLDGFAAGADDFSVRVRAAHIPMDEQLVRALPQAQQDVLAQFELDATASVDVTVKSDMTGERPFDYAAHLEVAGRRLVSAGFAIPLEDVRIIADLTQETIGLREMTARYGDGRLLLGGHIAAAGDDGETPGFCLAVEAVGVDLDEPFWAAADGQIPFPPGVRLGGAVDVAGRWSRNVSAEGCEPTDLTVVCLDNPVWVDGQTVGEVSGAMRFEDGRVRLDDFHVKGLLLGEALAAAMPERMRAAYERLDVTGRVDASIVSALLTLGEDGFGGIEATGRVRLDGIKSGSTDIVGNLNGRIEGWIALDAADQIKQVDAAYRAEDFDIRGRRVDRLSGRMVYDPNEGVLASRNFLVEVGNGKAVGSATVDIVNEASLLDYTLGLSFEQIGVDRLVASVPASGVKDDEPRQRGQAAGTMNVQGRIGRSDSKEGRLSVSVTNMQLGQQSLIGRMLTAIQFREPKDYVFNRMEIEAFVMGDELVIDRIRIFGRPFVFHGQGRLDLNTNRITMDLVALGGLSGLEPLILDSLLRGLGSALWKIEIRGAMDAPQIRTISLPILQLPLDVLELLRK